MFKVLGYNCLVLRYSFLNNNILTLVYIKNLEMRFFIYVYLKNYFVYFEIFCLYFFVVLLLLILLLWVNNY